ncbi:MAG: phosphopentomutase [Bacteroidota bacterium]|nr:phosphopentomutase [Bacteroidota bacterium]
MKGKIVFIVLDGAGIGELPDAQTYGDAGTNTLAHTASAVGGIHLPALQSLGLGNISSLKGVPPAVHPRACYGKMSEVSKGKDSTTGHWEISGLIVQNDFPYYPAGFPPDVVEKFLSATGAKGMLGNKAASGTEIIQELGDEHLRTGYPIVYTSADSVFQIAAHEDVIPLESLYAMCRTVRDEVMVGKHAVGRVIARPFTGASGGYTRTTNRKDFALAAPGTTVLDILHRGGIPTVSIGKIDDLFSGRGLKEKIHTHSNAEGIEEIISSSRSVQYGFLMANLVDFDMLFGHRQDARGMATALEYFDSKLPEILSEIHHDDVLVITADHGNDPTDKSTDHSREYVPLLWYSENGKHGADLGIRKTFADAGKTVAEYFGVDGSDLAGTSFLRLVMN